MLEQQKQLDHLIELWDKLDPRDRELLLKCCPYHANVRYDWRVLSKEVQENLLKWFYGES